MNKTRRSNDDVMLTVGETIVHGHELQPSGGARYAASNTASAALTKASSRGSLPARGADAAPCRYGGGSTAASQAAEARRACPSFLPAAAGINGIHGPAASLGTDNCGGDSTLRRRNGCPQPCGGSPQRDGDGLRPADRKSVV